MAKNFASIALTCLFMCVGFGATSVPDDRAECAEKLVGLATCHNYAGGSAKSPSPDCCVGLKAVVEKNATCLCILVNDSDDPNLGLKFNACNVPRLNLITCIDVKQGDSWRYATGKNGVNGAVKKSFGLHYTIARGGGGGGGRGGGAVGGLGGRGSGSSRSFFMPPHRRHSNRSAAASWRAGVQSCALIAGATLTFFLLG